MKKGVRDFTGKDDYKVGDLSKEVDARVKDERTGAFAWFPVVVVGTVGNDSTATYECRSGNEEV